tara:strand:- start:257 stop:775 length:519 start_codon:yes stop_codon:yes gene_type:complete
MTDKESVIFTYGRFNPPHRGHKKMIEEIVTKARKNKKTPVIVVSHSTKPPNKNPLNQNNKIKILKGWFPNVKVLKSAPNKSIAKITEDFNNNSLMVVGENRKNSFNFLPFRKNSIQRPKNAASATRVRTAVSSGNVRTYKNLTRYNSKNSNIFFQKIKSGLIKKTKTKKSPK